MIYKTQKVFFTLRYNTKITTDTKNHMDRIFSSLKIYFIHNVLFLDCTRHEVVEEGGVIVDDLITFILLSSDALTTTTTGFVIGIAHAQSDSIPILLIPRIIRAYPFSPHQVPCVKRSVYV